MDKSHDITVINTLIATTLDSVKGYRESAEDSQVATHAQFFREMSEERSRVASDLQAHVRALGGEPEMESSTAGAVHRTWLNIKEAVTGQDEGAIVNEVERGEDYIKDKYEVALRDGDLSPETRGVLEKCMESIRKGHDRASAMKHALAH
ncbi:PA2169 family four-helix-bundle protein [Altererythrobacter soli]|uniref:PA2169 family four-helix-bundle protein n=1 Tax=Croceibacterium soli TaxID=1739690 RepID=A0A6I4UWI2_9SPHN|nr:PA2169 family four-helix-bundle protein [Croceibacterium soli]MXP41345.1 PA2169 family four-helix-bundle protein [Croceibacterium soli]